MPVLPSSHVSVCAVVGWSYTGSFEKRVLQTFATTTKKLKSKGDMHVAAMHAYLQVRKHSSTKEEVESRFGVCCRR